MSYNTSLPSPQSPSNAMKNFDSKPSSPRAVEVQRAVIPQVMQAVTQNTDDYISSKAPQPKQHTPDNYGSRPPMQNRNDPSSGPRSNSLNPNQGESFSNQQHSPMMQGAGYRQSPSSPMHNQQHFNQPPQQYSPQPAQHYQQRPNVMSNKPMPSPPSHQQQRPTPPPHQQQRPGPPPQQQQFAPRPQNAGYNINKPLPGTNSYQTSPGNPPQNQQYQARPGQYYQPRPEASHLQPPNQNNMRPNQPGISPPHSPNIYNGGNDIKSILYTNNQCEVFHWHNQSWYAAEGQPLLQIRLSHSNRTCVTVQFQNTGELYLNAWILSNTVIRQPSPTDISLSLFIGPNKENYLIHFHQPQDAQYCLSILQKAFQDSTATYREVLPEQEEPEPVDTVNVPQTLKPVMQCKGKLFIQNETNNWSTFGSVQMKISQQSPSLRMLIEIENDKTKLVSAIVKSGNVEKIGPKRITFLLADEATKTSIVYMIQVREDETGTKLFEYLRIKNAENGW